MSRSDEHHLNGADVKATEGGAVARCAESASVMDLCIPAPRAGGGLLPCRDRGLRIETQSREMWSGGPCRALRVG